jgi:hypothetical protein
MACIRIMSDGVMAWTNGIEYDYDTSFLCSCGSVLELASTWEHNASFEIRKDVFHYIYEGWYL